MPYIFRQEKGRDEQDRHISHMDFDGYIARNIEEILWLKRYQEDKTRKIIADYMIYTMNDISRAVAKELGADRLTYPVESNLNELRHLGCDDLIDNELIVYGRLPMMISAQCLQNTTTGCDKKPKWLMLVDRRSEHMPVYNHCKYCYNTILNAKPLSLVVISDEINKLDISSIRICLTTEHGDSIRHIIEDAISAYKYKKNISDTISDYTRGHIKRGIL